MAVSPLNINIQMVDQQGRPTPQFMRWWQEFLAAVNPLSLPSGISNLFDVLGDTQGSLLIRGAAQWALLTPGTNGQALVSQGVGADPVWQTRLFTSLNDVPSSYGSQALKGVRVNAGETALEFYTVPTSVTAFLGLSDTPASYTGAGGNFVKVNAGATGLEFVAGGGGGGGLTKIGTFTLGSGTAEYALDSGNEIELDVSSYTESIISLTDGAVGSSDFVAFRVSNDSGFNFDSGASDYTDYLFGDNFDTINAKAAFRLSGTGTSGLTGFTTVIGLNDSALKTHVESQLGSSTDNTKYQGYRDAAQADDYIQILTFNGNAMTAGILTVYGVA